MKEVLVTIAIPNYNYGSYICKSVQSALSQTYTNIEIIIVDNCSTDNSMEIINKYKEHKNIRIYKNNKNIGMTNNFNKCYEYSNGEFIVFLSSDDLLKENFIEECMNIFEKNEIGIVCTDVYNINALDEIQESNGYYKTSCIIPGKEQARVFMMGNGFAPSQVLIKRSCMDKVGMFNSKYTFPFDWEMWFRIAMNYDIAYLNKKLAFYRIHNNTSSTSIKNLTALFEIYMLKIDFAKQVEKDEYLSKHIDESIKKLARNSIIYSIEMIKIKSYDLAKKYLDISKVFDPTVIEKNSYKTLYFILEYSVHEGKYELYEKMKYLMLDEYMSLSKPYDIPFGSKIIH